MIYVKKSLYICKVLFVPSQEIDDRYVDRKTDRLTERQQKEDTRATRCVQRLTHLPGTGNGRRLAIADSHYEF